MKTDKMTPYGRRKAYCKCICKGFGKEDFVVPFTEYFAEVSQRCPKCRERYFYFTIVTLMNDNIAKNLK